MLAVFEIVAPVFALVAIGWAAAKGGIVSPEGGRALGALILWIAMPALIVRAFVERGVTEVLDWRMAAGYAGASLALLVATYVLLRLRGRPHARAGVGAMGAAGPNSGFIGYPLVTLALGPEMGAMVLANALLVENAMTVPLSLALAQRGGGASPLRAAWGLLKAAFTSNPLLGSVILGAVLSLSGIGLPGPSGTVIALLSGAATPVALIAVGAALAHLPEGTARRDRPEVAAAKLVLHPALVLGAVALLIGSWQDPRAVGMALTAASPMMAAYPAICARVQETPWAAATLVTAMAGSVASLPLWLWALGV
ncbi:AEC family transporter [Rhodovulum sp. DZ06]|uniref:AEC family transporter n=1 Tax=Rhodovulum sp. DZ06 TaxID=3425126 RepID=UPI003D3358E9